MNKKEIIAFAVSPILPVFLFSLGIIVWQFGIAIEHGYGAFLSVTAGLAVLGIVVSYSVILLFIVPLYYVMSKRSKVTKVNIYLIAGIAGAVIIAVVSTMFGADEILELLLAFVIGALLGISGGYVFLRVSNMPTNAIS